MNHLYMVCLRVADAPRNDPNSRIIPGSVERNCPDCGHAVYVSPASLHHVNSGARLVCSHCVRAEHVASVEMSREQARGLAAYLRRN